MLVTPLYQLRLLFVSLVAAIGGGGGGVFAGGPPRQGPPPPERGSPPGGGAPPGGRGGGGGEAPPAPPRARARLCLRVESSSPPKRGRNSRRPRPAPAPAPPPPPPPGPPAGPPPGPPPSSIPPRSVSLFFRTQVLEAWFVFCLLTCVCQPRGFIFYGAARLLHDDKCVPRARRLP